MQIELQRHGERCDVVMRGELTIYTATDAKTALLSALATSDELDLNLEGLHELDTAGLQVLLLAKREALLASKRVRLVGHSTPVVDALQLCSLVAVFGDPIVLPAQRD